MQKNQMITIGIVLVVLLVGAFLVLSSRNNSVNKDVIVEESTEETSEEAVIEETSIESTDEAKIESGELKTFEVEGTEFAFDVKEIKVNKGDTVRIVYTNAKGVHDWVIDEFDAKTKTLQAGATETVEFVADQVGTFEYYCSVGQHRANGMVGNLIVEE